MPTSAISLGFTVESCVYLSQLIVSYYSQGLCLILHATLKLLNTFLIR